MVPEPEPTPLLRPPLTLSHIQGALCNAFPPVGKKSVVTGPDLWYGIDMREFTAVVERCPDTKLFVGYVPGFPGAHSQGATLEELRDNLREVIQMLLEDGEPELEAEFIGTQAVMV